MPRTCYEYVPRQSCIAAERTKNFRFSGRTQRHSLPQNASSTQPRRQFVPQAFFCKFLNIIFVVAAAAVPQNTFHSLYRPLKYRKNLVSILLQKVLMHACQIGPTDTAPPCSRSPHWACIETTGEVTFLPPFLLCYLSVRMVRLHSPFIFGSWA